MCLKNLKKKKKRFLKKKKCRKSKKKIYKNHSQKKTEQNQISKNALKAQEQKQASLPQKKSSKPSSAAKKSEPSSKTYTYKKSLEELMEEQMLASAKPKAFDESMFDDVVAETNTSSQSVSKNVNRMDSSSALSGSAAVAADSTSGSVSATADRAEKPSSASSATSAMLSKISAAQYSTTIGNGLSSKSDVKVAQSTDGKLAIELSDGSARVLLEPLKPVIIISEENGKRIDSSRQVVISFRILAAGNVPFSGITITPSSALPEEIQSEIKDQVSTWRFAPASSDGQAKFEYSIIKR